MSNFVSIRAQVSDLYVLVSTGEFTLKAAKEAVSNLEPADCAEQAAILSHIVGTVRTKKGFSDALDKLQELEEPAPAEEPAEEQAAPVTYLEELATEIDSHLKVAADSHIKAGNLLIEAREEFDNQKEFLAWTKERFGISKTHAYRLMKVAKEFGQDERFAGIGVRVLEVLTGAGVTPEQVQEAAELAGTGELDSTTVRAVVAPDALETEVETDAPVVPEDAPDGEETAPVALPAEPVPAPVVTAPVEEAPAPDAALMARLDALLEQNAALQAQIREMESKNKRVQRLPMLPHFQSDNFATRLGLVEGATVAAVRAAYRAIVQHYSEEANAEAFKLLTEAKDNLI